MIITLSGITGCGKSYYKNLLVHEMNIENMIIYTTREKREGEVEGIDKFFVTKPNFRKLIQNKEIFASYEFLGEYYGYSKKYLQKSCCCVTELHYQWIKDFKQKGKKVFSIYIIPNDIQRAKEEIKKRNLPKKVEELRFKEIEEHIENMESDEELKKQFDFVFYNNYDRESCDRMIHLMKKYNLSEEKKVLI